MLHYVCIASRRRDTSRGGRIPEFTWHLQTQFVSSKLWNRKTIVWEMNHREGGGRDRRGEITLYSRSSNGKKRDNVSLSKHGFKIITKNKV